MHLTRFFAILAPVLLLNLSLPAQNFQSPAFNNAPYAMKELIPGKELVADSVQKEEKKKHWYDVLAIRGYTQIRYNRLLETNPKLKCDQCDKSWGDNNSFFVRRARLILFGNVGDHLSIYIQPDLASSPSSTLLHFVQLRDAYFDYFIDKNKEFRIRFGQSKIPYGFENLQSSQNRLPLDRNDAMNSALPNERDLGAIFYYAPKKIRDRFKMLVDEGFKGSGDYGVAGLGVYNGQTANKPELNDNLHIVGRISYPFQIGSQIIEPGVQGYTGKFTIAKDQLTSGTKTNKELTYDDQRAAASLVLYPRPFGILAEYNVGKTPAFSAVNDSIINDDLNGGAVTMSYMHRFKNKMVVVPFVRGQYFNGAKKQETDARRYVVREYEFGVEYQIFKYMELTAMYTMSERTTVDKAAGQNAQKGNLLRLQLQFNY